jgi:glycerol-3-phosphate dehydrogenase subunit C
MLKNVLKVGAYYSAEYRESLKSDDGFVRIPMGGVVGSAYGDGAYMSIPVEFFAGMLKDEGCFSSISAKKRIMVAENTYDIGEYLWMLHERDEFDTRLGPVSDRGVYYPPCHLRRQRIGRPYQYLLSLIPELSVEPINGNYCCGNGGIMGFKQEFHRLSIKIGSRLIAKIKSLNPEVIATDCLSCKIQFNQLTNYEVLHPIQIIKESYSNYQEQSEKKAV